MRYRGRRGITLYKHILWHLPVEIILGEMPCGVLLDNRTILLFADHPRHSVVGEWVATVLHEVLHAAHPRKGEAWIENKMKRLHQTEHRLVRETYARICHVCIRELRTLTPDRAKVYDSQRTPNL